MRHLFIIVLSLITFASGKPKCSPAKRTPNTNCYKGKLAIKGICLHYVVSVVEGPFDTTKMVANWKDPQSGKTYHHVFTISNPCSFPDSIKEGDTFYFTIDSTAADDCIRCMAYREVPPVQNPIAVKSKGCE